MQIDIFRKSHFGHDYQGLLHYISIFFSMLQSFEIYQKKKKIYIWNANPKGSAGNYFS